jgi:hypothetical protein
MFGGRNGALVRNPFELRIRRTTAPQSNPVYVNYASRRVTVSVWPGRTAEDAVGWLVWAVAEGGRYLHPGRPVKAICADVADEAWPGLGRRSGSTENEVIEAIIEALGVTGRLKKATR